MGSSKSVLFVPFLPPEKNLPKGQTFYMFGRSRYDISHPGGMIDYDRISYLFNPNKHNLLINGIYRGYNPLILTFDPNFLEHPIKGQGRVYP